MASLASLLDMPQCVALVQKNSAAELLTGKGTQLLLILSLGFQLPQGVINLDLVF